MTEPHVLPRDPAPPDLSVVIPVHDEEANLRPLWGELRAVLDDLDLSSEVIFVDDGSTDGTGRVLDEIRGGDRRVRVLDHDRNHGLTAALDCGFRHARGDVVAMLDGDGQNPPGELPRLLERLPPVDMVIGWRRERDDPWLKRLSSKVANAYRNWRTHERVHDVGCGLKVFRRQVLERVKLYDGMHRFLPTLARMDGFEVAEVEVAHRPRTGGRSHYGVWNRLWKGLRDVRTVRWMWRNRLTWRATERPPVDPEGGDRAAEDRP